MDKHENQRVRLTKKLFRDSLIALLRKKKIYQITVSELCAAAELNRSSFYKHYGNVYDVLAELGGGFPRADSELRRSDRRTRLRPHRRAGLPPDAPYP